MSSADLACAGQAHGCTALSIAHAPVPLPSRIEPRSIASNRAAAELPAPRRTAGPRCAAALARRIPARTPSPARVQSTRARTRPRARCPPASLPQLAALPPPPPERSKRARRPLAAASWLQAARAPSGTSRAASPFPLPYPLNPELPPSLCRAQTPAGAAAAANRARRTWPGFSGHLPAKPTSPEASPTSTVAHPPFLHLAPPPHSSADLAGDGASRRRASLSFSGQFPVTPSPPSASPTSSGASRPLPRALPTSTSPAAARQRSAAAAVVATTVSGHPRPRDLPQPTRGELLATFRHFPGPGSPPFGRRKLAGEPRDLGVSSSFFQGPARKLQGLLCKVFKSPGSQP